MIIGYGSEGIYFSIRYDLYFDKTNNTAYFTNGQKKYIIKLSNNNISNINKGKILWITLLNEKTATSNISHYNENEVKIRVFNETDKI